MNPTANKSDFEDLTTNLRDLAYSYLEKYSPSKQQLKVYLLKKYLTKIKGTKSKKEVTSIIDEIISKLEKNKILNDINLSAKPYVIYKTSNGFDLFTDFSKKIILSNNNVTNFL